MCSNGGSNFMDYPLTYREICDASVALGESESLFESCDEIKAALDNLVDYNFIFKNNETKPQYSIENITRSETECFIIFLKNYKFPLVNQ